MRLRVGITTVIAGQSFTAGPFLELGKLMGTREVMEAGAVRALSGPPGTGSGPEGGSPVVVLI
ncbi:hypothetical protein Ppa06_06070 [Planomonospora parontospora subsp. parontospora]|uniref:Uncharacterized protein n=2 Tax=Planomonospora parontospora TaxID=58119 RepID=A0AA37F2L8_9ACTN|nr:hypothetical protein GCM10010126_10540 [Planomonospora parontospora]GII06809.1 hypothetical protein Ppa06_06070 [Planomonospora parontospora subsp. parontospora]